MGRTCGSAIATATAVLTLAGCAGGGTAADGEPPPPTTETAITTVAESRAPTKPAKASPSTAAVSETGATKAEVRWAANVIEWGRGVGATVEFAEARRAAIVRGRRIADRAVLRRALRALLGCHAYTQETVGDPPSDRLVPVLGAMEHACNAYASGAEAALELLSGADRRHRAALAGQWEAGWASGHELMASVEEELRDYQPANARPLPTRGGAIRRTRVEPEFSRVASRLVKTRVEVRCWAPKDWKRLIRQMKRLTKGRVDENTAGFVGYGDRRANLDPQSCAGLVALRYGKARPTEGIELGKVVWGVHVLMHEAQHARGVWNEAGAECYGMQMIREAARRLGATRDYAALLAEAYWTRVYPYAPAEYRSPECRDGGALDSDLKSAVWP